MKICGIYKLTSPCGGVYIGQSTDISNRKKYYRTGNCKGQRKVYESILKFGWENHVFEILCECSIELLNEKETFYIKLHQSFNTINGMNLDSGGLEKKQSYETKKKRSESLKGRIFTQEWKDKIGAKSKGRMLGFKHSEETIFKLKNTPRKKWDKPHPLKGTGYTKEEAKLRHNESNKRYRMKIKQLKTTT